MLATIVLSAATLKSYLALLMTVCQYLQTVGGYGQKLYVHTLQQSYHLLKTISRTYGQLGTFLVQQQVV